MVLLCHNVFAQNKISGTISDQGGEALVGATIYIPDLNKGTVSNSEGRFELANLPNGKLRIQFSYLGYTNRIETVHFQNSDIELNIVLNETAIEAEEIVVSSGYNSTQHENAVKIDILKLNSAEQIATPNFTEALTAIPGVDMISKGNGISKPVIRGLSMNDILVLNNGVRFENYQYSEPSPAGN